MLNRTTIMAATLILLAGPALASGDEHRSRDSHRGSGSSHESRCPDRPSAQWMPSEQMAQKLKRQGYSVDRIERSHGCFEVHATDSSGAYVELYVDPASGQIVRRRSRR